MTIDLIAAATAVIAMRGKALGVVVKSYLQITGNDSPGMCS